METNSITTYLPADGLHFVAPVCMLIPLGNGIFCKAFIDENLSNDARRSYDIVTAAENYDYAIAQYVEGSNGMMPAVINVLLIYYEADKLFYHTLAVQVHLERVNNKTKADETGYDVRVVLPFGEWQNQIDNRQ